MQNNLYIPLIKRTLSFALFLLAIFSGIHAQETVAVGGSALIDVKLPENASRVVESDIPQKTTNALQKLIVAAGRGIRQGNSEVLVWPVNSRRTHGQTIIRELVSNIQSAGWSYEVGSENDGVIVFGITRNTPKNRLVFGFYTFSDKAVVLAWTEALAANEPISNISPSTNNGSAKIINADKGANHVNVMGNEMPPMPDFPKLAPKPGKVRGYVKDWSGRPLAGAEIGIRSSYFAGYYSGGQGKTDANGYYELSPPKGMAHFYNAGYQIKYGDGVAAVSLHPADGKLDSFVTTNGVVENFVLLPYGITSRENLQQNPHLPSTFYGGAIYLNWYGVEADDGNAPDFAVKEGSLIEITLTPEGKMIDGSAGQTIVVRKVAGSSGGFRIHNIPLGRYQISIKANGKSLKIKDTEKFSQQFGLMPAEATGTASILFVPDQAKASMVTPQHGAWKWVSLNIEIP